MKMIWCGLKNKENDHELVNQFHGNFRSKTLCCRKIKYVFRDVKLYFNAPWGLKGLTGLKSYKNGFRLTDCPSHIYDVFLIQLSTLPHFKTNHLSALSPWWTLIISDIVPGKHPLTWNCNNSDHDDTLSLNIFFFRKNTVNWERRQSEIVLWWFRQMGN